ncbi:MAG: threonine synthase [Saprospiraceae bacterium]|nr:threonine synthase [Saprospiraceae bacterium]
MIHLKKTSQKCNIKNLYLKEEGGNPTGSFKARGIGMAVSKAKELGISAFCIPTAGNAGSALTAYVASSDGQAYVYMPETTPRVFTLDCEVMGAKVSKVKGSIRDAGLAMAKDNINGQWWDITTLKEPFRLEGKKTMGYEIAEQLDWILPDVIIYPTGGGTGLIGIWKAFQEMMELGWVDHIPTRMVAVQAKGCNPVVQAYQTGMDHCTLFENPEETMANGLRVPKAFGDRLIMRTIKESNGIALDVTEEEMMASIHEFGRSEGIFLSPEGAAVYCGSKKLIATGYIKSSEKVVIINTGSPYKYVDNMS